MTYQTANPTPAQSIPRANPTISNARKSCQTPIPTRIGERATFAQASHLHNQPKTYAPTTTSMQAAPPPKRSPPPFFVAFPAPALLQGETNSPPSQKILMSSAH